MSRKRLLLALLAGLVVTVLAVSALVGSTLAQWVNVQRGTADVGAASFPGPASTTCTTVRPVLHDRAHLSWPSVNLPPEATGVRYRLHVATETATTEVFTSATEYEFQVTFLEGLVGGLLGQERKVHVTVEALYQFPGSEWTAQSVAKRELRNHRGVLGINAYVRCTVEGYQPA